MRRFLIILGIVLSSLVVVYIFFVSEESIRLKRGGEHPLIITGGTCDGDKTEHTGSYKTDCHSLGFRLEREYVLDEKSSDDNKMYKLVREEFWLFEKYLVWGWVS